jgi:hypothetical protein
MVASEFKTTIEFRVSRGVIKISELFTILDQKSENFGITEWGMIFLLIHFINIQESVS